MKNTKNTLRVIFCLVMTLVIVFSLASCDIKGAFQSLGNGDFKGAWASLTGKHKHAYTSVVTAPTCTDEGYTTYTCECGDTYTGDKVAALGHDYKEKVTRFPTPMTDGVISNLCARCGAHTDKSIPAVTFELPAVSEFLRTLVGTNVLEISASNAEIIVIDKIYYYPSGRSEETTDYVALDPGYICISGEGDEIYGYISFALGVATYNGSMEDTLPTYEEQISVIVMVNGEDVSVSVTENGNISEESVRLSEIFYNALAQAYGMSYEEFVEMVYVGGKSTVYISLLQGAIEALGEVAFPEDGADLEKLLELVADELVEVDGNTYKINIAGLSNVIETVQGKTLTELVDEKYGAGTMARVEDFVTSLPTAKLRDIADAALKFSEKCGVPLDDVYSYINYIVYMGTGEDFNIESEIITRYDMTLVAVILELSGDEDITVEEATEELTTNLREAFAQVKDLDVDELYNLFAYGDPERKFDGKKFSITESLISSLGMLGEEITAEITVTDDGAIEKIYVYIDDTLTLSAGYDEGGYSVDLEYYLADIDNRDHFKYVVDVNELDATFKVIYNDNEMFYAYLTFNELGELLSADVVTKDIVYVSGTHVDEFGNVTHTTTEMIEDGATIKYVNNGDGTHSVDVNDGHDNWTVDVVVTETEEELTVTGSFSTEYYYNEQIDCIDNGTFTYVEKRDGSGISFKIKVSETAYNYTEKNVDGNNVRNYDYDNPKTFNIFGLELVCDVNGIITFDAYSNYISRNGAVEDVGEGYNATYTLTLEADIRLNAEATWTDETVHIEFCMEDGKDKLTASANFNVEQIGPTETAPMVYYYPVLDSATVTYTDGDDINFSLSYKMTETDKGVKIDLDVDGFRYTKYNYRDYYEPGTIYPDYPDYPDYPEAYVPEYDGSEVTVVFYHTMGSSLQGVLNSYIADFNEMYPNITIEHTQIGGYDDVRDWIKKDLVCGSAPSIAYCYPEHVALYNLTGMVLPLDDLINNSYYGFTEYQLNDFVESFYAEGAVYDDGNMYTLPMCKSTELLYYNKTFFDEHGLSVPTTWEEMEAVCAAIKAIDPDCIPLGYDSEANLFITLCQQLGTPYTSATGEHFLFDNPENQEFVKMLRDWYDKGYIITQELYGGYTSNLFSNGNSYMSIGSSAGARHQLPPTGDDGWPVFEMGIAPIPQVDPTNTTAVSQGPSLCMFKQDNPQEMAATWLFMKFLTTDVNFQASFSMASGYMPVIKSVMDHPSYRSFIDTALATSSGVNALAVKVAMNSYDYFYTVPAFNGASVARDQVGKLIQYCLTMPTDNIDAMIDKAFKDAIAECAYRS